MKYLLIILSVSLVFLSPVSMAQDEQDLCQLPITQQQLPPISSLWSIKEGLIYGKKGGFYLGTFPAWNEFLFQNSEEIILHTSYYSRDKKTYIFTRTKYGFGIYSYDNKTLNFIKKEILKYSEASKKIQSPAIAIHTDSQKLYALGNFHAAEYDLGKLISSEQAANSRSHVFSSVYWADPIRGLSLIPRDKGLYILASRKGRRSYHIIRNIKSGYSLPAKRSFGNNYIKVFNSHHGEKLASFSSFTASSVKNKRLHSTITGGMASDNITVLDRYILDSAFFSYPISNDPFAFLALSDGLVHWFNRGVQQCSLFNAKTKQILSTYEKNKKIVYFLTQNNILMTLKI